MTTHILAIDDSRTIRTLLTMALEGAGFKVTTAVNMPNKDGFGVITDIRSGTQNASVPVLVLSTESGASLKERARTAGATGWIVKPFEDAALINVIRRLTGG